MLRSSAGAEMKLLCKGLEGWSGRRLTLALFLLIHLESSKLRCLLNELHQLLDWGKDGTDYVDPWIGGSSIPVGDVEGELSSTHFRDLKSFKWVECRGTYLCSLSRYVFGLYWFLGIITQSFPFALEIFSAEKEIILQLWDLSPGSSKFMIHLDNG